MFDQVSDSLPELFSKPADLLSFGAENEEEIINTCRILVYLFQGLNQKIYCYG